jgi:hypothetical protein
MEVAPNHPSHGSWLSIESYGDLGIPQFKKHPYSDCGDTIRGYMRRKKTNKMFSGTQTHTHNGIFRDLGNLTNKKWYISRTIMGIYIYIHIGRHWHTSKNGVSMGSTQPNWDFDHFDHRTWCIGKTRSKPETQLSIHWVYPSLLGFFSHC